MAKQTVVYQFWNILSIDLEMEAILTKLLVGFNNKVSLPHKSMLVTHTRFK